MEVNRMKTQAIPKARRSYKGFPHKKSLVHNENLKQSPRRWVPVKMEVNRIKTQVIGFCFVVVLANENHWTMST
jgi:hypothetical protein